MLSLKQCLTLPDAHNWGGRADTPDGPLYFHDHGARVLGVAHLDTVLQARPVKSGPYVFAPQLDDRLGVYCLLNLLPTMGINLDVLLTTGEEHCRSTARHFQGRYNWVVEFDRAGTDCVFYQYGVKAWQKVWRRAFHIGQGSYSDIASLDLGVCCANLGIGYHNQHSRYCHANLEDTRKQLSKFALLYRQYEAREFPYSEIWDRPRALKTLRALPARQDWARWQDDSGIWRDKEGFFDAWEEYKSEEVI